MQSRLFSVSEIEIYAESDIPEFYISACVQKKYKMKILRLPILALFIIGIIAGMYAQPVGSMELRQQRYAERVQYWNNFLDGLAYVPDEIIVEFGDARLLNSIDGSVLQGFEMTGVFRYRPVAVYRNVGGKSLAESLASMEAIPGIRSVGPNLIRTCAYTPNDSLFDRQEYMLPIHAEDAWDVTTGSSSVNVAVIDTGVDIDHPEFAGRIIYTENTRNPEGEGATNVFDDSGHGTAVSGIIAAQGNNGIGIAGMAWDVRLLAFRACGGADLSCTLADEVEAIDSAVAHGADVINLSLGGKGTNSLETNAIRDAYDAGVVICAASGNGNPGELYAFTGDSGYDQANMYYPAAFPEVMGVAALDNQNGSITDPASLTRASFSNFGEDIVSVAAVGTAVMTTVPYRPKSEVPYAIYPMRDYSRLSGTSFACPQVTGLAALILSRIPNASPVEVRTLIETTAWPMGGPDIDANQVDDYLGHGLLDAGAALGSSSGVDGIFENTDFRMGITPSPLFNDDIFVIVKCKNGCDTAPVVSYFVHDSGQSAALDMQLLPAHPNTFIGRFTTTATGEITIQAHALLGGVPLEPLVVVYTLIN
jgi:thermitase